MIEHALAVTNLRRLRVLLVGVILIEALFLVQVERVRLIEEAHEFVIVSYVLHSVLAFIAMGLFVFLYFVRNTAIERYAFMQRLPGFAVFVILVLVAVISLFDQVTHGHITLFSVHLLAFGLLMTIKPWWNIPLFSVPYIIFIIGVSVFQYNRDVMVTHIINGSIIYLGVLFSTTVFYRNKVQDLRSQALLEQKNVELEALSTIDPLTKLPNRRYFERQLHYEASIGRRYRHAASLIIMDIDDFKLINDTHGHDVGDDVLVSLSKLLTNGVRESDTVCRWGGEEFMILLSHTEIDGAMILAERMRKRIADTVFDRQGLSLSITASFGVTRLVHEHDEGFKHSYKNADEALYVSKKSGKNKVTLHP